MLDIIDAKVMFFSIRSNFPLFFYASIAIWVATCTSVKLLKALNLDDLTFHSSWNQRLCTFAVHRTMKSCKVCSTMKICSCWTFVRFQRLRLQTKMNSGSTQWINVQGAHALRSCLLYQSTPWMNVSPHRIKKINWLLYTMWRVLSVFMMTRCTKRAINSNSNKNRNNDKYKCN